MKNALVIGGTGYLGRHVIASLKSRSITIYATCNKTPFPQDSAINVVHGGIAAIDHELINRIKPDVIFHLARPAIPRLRRLGRIVAAQLAAYYNQRLIRQLMLSRHRPRLVFASGSLMYGNSSNPHDEDAPLNPVSYARDYLAGEMPLVRLASSGSYPCMVIRLPWMLGNGSWFRWFYLNSVARSGKIPAFGNTLNMMEIIDVHDAAQMVIAAADKAGKPGVFNVVTQGAISQDVFLQTTASAFDAAIVDHSELFGKVEKAVYEAFTSSIQITTKYPELYAGFSYTPLMESLEKIAESK